MIKTPAIAARILAGALALAAHSVSAQAPDVPGAPSAEPPAQPAPAPATRAPGAAGVAIAPRAGEVVLNFQGADLQAVVKAMSQMTGRNMLIDPRVRGQVTIVSARPMPVAAGYQIFLSALKTQGFTAVEGPGDAVRIIPVAEAKAAAPVNEQDGPPRGGEQVVTHVVIGQHVAVAQLQNVLRPLMSPTSQLSVYDPANALIITDYADNVRRLLRIIERIDQPASTDVTVIPVQHASAIDLAELVVRLSGTGVAGQTAAPGGRPGGAAPSLIQADEATNSIIINASDTVYNNLRLVIEQLDVRRAQVYVEALIVEMTADAANELGIQWAGGTQRGSTTLGAAANFPSAKPSIGALAAAPAATAATAAGLTVAVLGRTITLPDGTSVRSLGALARALQTNSLNNILSTPTLLTLDNYQAKIVVGQNVPFITGSFAQATAAAAAAGGTTGAVVNPFQTIERRDVGLTLRIKPQISEGGAIRLEIFQEVSRIDLTSQGVASDVVTTKRSLETKVVVDDGSTIVLGGLIDHTIKETQEAIPLLGSIPILGALFRFRQEVRQRTNLMIFLRPVIVRSADDTYRD